MMPEMSRFACFMPLIATSGTASWSRGRSRRPTPSAKPSCRTTTGALSPVHSVARGSTTKTSATTNNASWALDAAHEVIRALGLRSTGRNPPPLPEDTDTDSDLEMVPEAPAGSAPAGPRQPAGSVQVLCHA